VKPEDRGDRREPADAGSAKIDVGGRIRLPSDFSRYFPTHPASVPAPLQQNKQKTSTPKATR